MKKQQKTSENKRRWVIKIGSSLVTNDGQGLNLAAIDRWCADITQLHQQGYEIILVSSGAVAEGMARLQWHERPHALHELQAAAAVGQMGLIQAYEKALQKRNLQSAQILLTHEDLRDRQRYINARSTLQTLLELDVIPVVNENDTVATEEIRFGDNDNLAALVANLIDAEHLVILTDQVGIFDRDPSQHADAQLIRECSAQESRLDAVAGPSHHTLGRGGMVTKVAAARRAERSGTATIITSGRVEGALLAVASGEYDGTLVHPTIEALTARKQWIANQLQAEGSLHLDAGATRVLLSDGASLLAVGITRVDGDFKRGDLVRLIDPAGNEVARGLSNYNSQESRTIAGHSSAEIEKLLGYIDEPELVHRDNLTLL